MKKIVSFFVSVILSLVLAETSFAQSKTSTVWVKVSDDEIATISYDSNIKTDQDGNKLVWVKVQYKSIDWQMYFANEIGSNVPVVTTKTKVMFEPSYNYVMVREVLCYNKANKLLYDTGDDLSAGWGNISTTDPVGIVGYYLRDHN